MKKGPLALIALFFALTSAYAALANEPPQAGFTYFPGRPDTLDLIQFLDTSTDADGTVSSWHWDFGDGEDANIQNPIHRYATSGSYTVSLTVIDNEGASDTYSETITVTQPPRPRENRFRLHLGMIPQTTSWEADQFDFDLEAYLDLAFTWDKTTFSIEGITGIAGPELVALGIETQLGLATLEDEFVFATPFDSEDRRLGGLQFIKKRFTIMFDFIDFRVENLFLAEDIHFTYPYPGPVQTPEYHVGDILTLKATTSGGIRLTSILGLCADPQLTNLLKRKSFSGRVCEDKGFQFTVEKLLIENLTLGNLRLDSETEFRLEEPTSEILDILFTLPGIGDLTAVLATEDIFSLGLERAILKLRSGAFTFTTVFDSTLSITSNSLIANLRLFDQMTLITTATFIPDTGLSSLTIYSLIPTGDNSQFKVFAIHSGGTWSSITFSFFTRIIEGLEFDIRAKFLLTGLEEVTFELELMF